MKSIILVIIMMSFNAFGFIKTNDQNIKRIYSNKKLMDFISISGYLSIEEAIKDYNQKHAKFLKFSPNRKGVFALCVSIKPSMTSNHKVGFCSDYQNIYKFNPVQFGKNLTAEIKAIYFDNHTNPENYVYRNSKPAHNDLIGITGGLGNNTTPIAYIKPSVSKNMWN